MSILVGRFICTICVEYCFTFRVLRMFLGRFSHCRKFGARPGPNSLPCLPPLRQSRAHRSSRRSFRKYWICRCPSCLSCLCHSGILTCPYYFATVNNSMNLLPIELSIACSKESILKLGLNSIRMKFTSRPLSRFSAKIAAPLRCGTQSGQQLNHCLR